MSGNTKLAFD